MSSAPSSSRLPQTPTAAPSGASNGLKRKRGVSRTPAAHNEHEATSAQHRPTRAATPRSSQGTASRTPSPRKVTRKPRAPRAIPSDSDPDEDQDAPHDEDYDDEQDAEGEDDVFEDTGQERSADEDGEFELEEGGAQSRDSPRTRSAPSRAAVSRPRRTRTALAIPDDEDEPPSATSASRNEAQKKQPKRSHKKRVPPPILDDEDEDGSRSDDSDESLGDKRKPRVQPEEPEEELDDEAKKALQAKREEEEMVTRWTEEYFEIVEQLPLEIHRSMALLRELESQMNTRLATITRDSITYRNARIALHRQLLDQAVPPLRQDPASPDKETSGSIHTAAHKPAEQTQSSGEEEAAQRGGHTESVQTSAAQSAATSSTTLQALQDTANTSSATSLAPPAATLSAQQRRALLQSISQSANEAVRAGEEKLGLAVTTYQWIDRQCRRLDADLTKVESSLVFGLRTGTSESRGLLEAQGLPVDGDGGADGDAAADADAEGDVDSPMPGLLDDGDSTVKSNTVTPKLGGLTPLPEEDAAEGSGRKKRGRKGSAASSSGAPPSTRNRRTSAATRASTTPGPEETTDKPRRGRTTSQSSATKPGDAAAAASAVPTAPSPRRRQPPSLPATTSIVPGHKAMAGDPNEPRYCYCDQPSFDEMVACDNDDCPREWFHMSCVGLDAPPKGKWFCRFCAPPTWKGQGTEVPPHAKFKPPGFKGGKKKK